MLGDVVDLTVPGATSVQDQPHEVTVGRNTQAVFCDTGSVPRPGGRRRSPGQVQELLPVVRGPVAVEGGLVHDPRAATTRNQ